jgi:uncharacterized protein YjeT (DUF2065 family)
MPSTTDTTSEDDPACPDAWWAAFLADLSPADEARLRRVAAAFVGAEDDAPAPTLLDLQDAAHAARALANGLLLAIEGLGPGDERDALGRIGDLLARDLAALAAGLAATRSPSL